MIFQSPFKQTIKTTEPKNMDCSLFSLELYFTASHESHRKHFSTFNADKLHSNYIRHEQNLDSLIQYVADKPSQDKKQVTIHKKVREAEEKVREAGVVDLPAPPHLFPLEIILHEFHIYLFKIFYNSKLNYYCRYYLAISTDNITLILEILMQ